MTTEFTVADIESQTYTGEELTPSILVQNGETTLVEGTDYFITYKNTDGTDSDGKFINAGSYVVTVTGIGDYYGTIEKTFTILQFLITKSAFLLPAAISILFFNSSCVMFVTPLSPYAL